MKHICVIALLFATTILAPANALAQKDENEYLRDPFKGILEIVDWFTKLNDDFDQIVIVEKKGQLERAIDRLRKSLYAYEIDIGVFRDKIPDEKPEGDVKDKLWDRQIKSMSTLRILVSAVNDIGADIRLNDGKEVMQMLSGGFTEKGITLDYIQNALKNGPWNAEEIRGRLDKGIKAIRDAQIAVTEFEEKLSLTKADKKTS